MPPSPHMTAMIPARMGSERLKQKNLVMLGNEPMIGHAIKAARDSGVFQRVVINSESDIFAKIAARYGVEFYRRPAGLASSEARSDEVVKDFMEHHETDIVAWVNSTSPLQPAGEVAEVMRYFAERELDSLITVRREQVHCNFKGQPLNYRVEKSFAKTQELEPVERFVYSVMAWRKSSFLATYAERGNAILFGKTGFFPVSRVSSIIVKYEEDIRLLNEILAGKAALGDGPLVYFDPDKDV